MYERTATRPQYRPHFIRGRKYAQAKWQLQVNLHQNRRGPRVERSQFFEGLYFWV